MRLLFTLAIVALMTPVACLASLKPDADVNKVLDELYDVGKDLKSFSANVTLREKDEISGNSWSRSGMAVYEKLSDGDSRFRVTFLKRMQDELVQEQRIEYLLDKGWLYDRNYPRKLEVRRQMVRPGEKINLLKLGEGPFPLPIGQSREDVLKLFEAKKMEPAKSDPASTVHIQLTPRAGTQFERKFKSIDVWVALESSMPVRIETVDANESSRRGTDLSDVRLNVPLTNDHFALQPLPPDWQRREEPFSDQ